MAKVILETSMETSMTPNLNISTDKIVQAIADPIETFMVDQNQLERICTKTDHQLKAIMEAHLEDQAHHYTNKRQR